jgi:CheY-like chemotaxis protein
MRFDMTSFFPTIPVKMAPRETLLQHFEKLPPVALVVDDEPIIVETVAAILNCNGLAAMTALDGCEALETALAIPPEILITDLAMPRMNGLDLALEVRRSIPDCEVILSSGHASSLDLAERIAELDFDFAVLIKPVHPVDLLYEVFRLLRKHGSPVGAPKAFHRPAY